MTSKNKLYASKSLSILFIMETNLEVDLKEASPTTRIFLLFKIFFLRLIFSLNAYSVASTNFILLFFSE